MVPEVAGRVPLHVQIGHLGNPLSTVAATLEAPVLAGDPAVHVR